MGAVQGAAEFLPVSSSGHLVLAARILGEPPSLAFDLFLHLATLAAVVIVFRRELWRVIRSPLSARSRMLALSTLVTVAAAAALRGAVERTMDGALLPLFFSITAVTLIVSSHLPVRSGAEKPTAAGAAMIGIFQGLAAFPGLSRSGLTAAAGRMAGLPGEDNASYCFLLSVPVILGSGAVEIAGSEMTAVGAAPLAVGFITALVVGIVCLLFVKRLLVRGKTGGFAVYLLLLSAFLLLNDYCLHLF